MRESSFIPQANLALGPLFLLLFVGIALGQSSGSGDTSSASSSSLLLEFQQNQGVLAEQMAQMIAQGATPAEIFDWMNQNPIVQTQRSIASQLGVISAAQPMPLITSVTVPEDASQDLEDLLTTQASLANLRAQIHNELLQQGIVSGEQESALFQQQAAATLQQQAERAQRVGADTDAHVLPVPPPLSIPPNATPAMQAFLNLRDQLMRAEIQVHNQNLQVDQPTREAAVQAWIAAHADLFQQLQQLAQSLSD